LRWSRSATAASSLQREIVLETAWKTMRSCYRNAK
jgi:hypothetical protein